MKIDPEKESVALVYSLMTGAIAPRPIAWVSTISANGITNLAPFSYFNGICSRPAALMFSLVNKPDGSRKDTIRNIEANAQFVVNTVPFKLAEPMLKTAADIEYGLSEFEVAGLTTEPSEKVKPPRVAESPIHFECELIQIVNVGEGPLAAHVVIGKIVLMNIADSVLNEAGEIDPELVDSIGRMGGRDYCRTQQRFTLTP